MKRFLPFLAVGVITAISAWAHYNHIFFLAFVDESDNFLLGKYILSGKQLYSQMYSQHQPLTYFVSAVLQAVTRPDSILQLIRDHRGFMILWSAAWSLLLVWRFGWRMVGVVFVYELTKILLLGNLFLAEAIVAYPLAYLAGYVLRNDKTSYPWELTFLGLLLGFVVYQLLPLWPLAAFMYIYLLVARSDRLKTLFILGGTFLVCTLIWLPFSSVPEYLQSLFITYDYYIPLTRHFEGQVSLWQSLLSPVAALMEMRQSSLLWVLKAVSFSYLVSAGWLLYKRHYRVVAVSYALITLAAFRYVSPHQTLYGAFHMIPWYIILIVATWFLLMLVDKKLRILLILMIASITLWQGYAAIVVPRDRGTDFFVNYSDADAFARILKARAKPGETLFAVPNADLLYWDTNIPPATRYTLFYGWMEQVPPYANNAKELFASHPPTYVWCDCGTQFFKYGDVTRYSRFVRDGKPTKLYILQSGQ